MMTAINLAPCIGIELDLEGSFSNLALDPGGATNLGITQRTLAAWRKHSVTIDDVRNLSRDEATQIYTVQYASKVGFDLLPTGLDFVLLDTAVNSGASRAVKILQARLGFADEDVDGIMGTITLAAVQAVNDRASLIDAYCDDRLVYMKSLGIWSTFGKGWTSRVGQVRQHARDMLVGNMPANVAALDALAQAKATGAVKVTSTRSGWAAISTLGSTLAAAGAAAAQASGALAAFSDIQAVHYALAGLALVTAVGAFGVAYSRSQAGGTT